MDHALKKANILAFLAQNGSLSIDLCGYAVKTGDKGEGDKLRRRNLARRNLVEDDVLSLTARLLSFLGIPLSFREIQTFKKEVCCTSKR
ncbi:hypothetical protein AV530_006373 [Patagioenas fasciata monilis]|uniref:Uncharacterized protein n=1 Tax=Patagioenas fasciata monilis TaxID=372326 RepID=A0A1V4KGC7_PATFA|nr:hypothetical protein AV530_006373 [Patagioenas fasciata monilis]